MWNEFGKVWRQGIKWGVVLCGWILGTTAYATCDYNFPAGHPYPAGPAITTQPLSVSDLTVGRDVPNGTILYTQTVRPQQGFWKCTEGTQTLEARALIATPRPLTPWNTGKFAGKVYESGVSGIGVVLWRDNDVLPMVWNRGSCNLGAGVACVGNLPSVYMGVSISLIKIGPVSPGIISGVTLPTAQWRWKSTGNTGPLIWSTINFSGSIRIVSQTCMTPDVEVPLGEHRVSTFTGTGSPTEWQGFSIQLRNCPAFYGASASLRKTDSGTGWVEWDRAIAKNILQFSLTPTTTIVPIYAGTVQVSPTTSGPAAATGVGVQIANASNTPVQFDTLMSSGITPTDVANANYSIPLKARYIQILPGVTPGPANASVMFTINYQ